MKESIFKMYFLIFFNFGVLILGAYFFKEKGNPTSIGCELILLPPKIHFLYQYDKMDLKSVIGYFFFLPTLPGGPAVRLTELKKFKYYLIWEISSLSYYLTGLRISNINCLKVELASSLREVSWEWNRWGGIWLKECFFDRIDNPFMGGIITFLMGAFWHGAHLHDFSFFITYCFSMQLINYFQSFLPVNLFFNIFSKIETNLLISYVPIHFYYGNIKEGNSMLKKVYFYGHVYFFIIFMIFLYEKMFLRSVKKIKKNHSFKKV